MGGMMSNRQEDVTDEGRRGFEALAPIDVIRLGIKWMDWRLSHSGCKCHFTGHTCGLRERQQELEQMRRALHAMEALETLSNRDDHSKGALYYHLRGDLVRIQGIARFPMARTQAARLIEIDEIATAALDGEEPSSPLRVSRAEFDQSPSRYIEQAKGQRQVLIEEEGQPPTIVGVGDPLFELEVEEPGPQGGIWEGIISQISMLASLTRTGARELGLKNRKEQLDLIAGLTDQLKQLTEKASGIESVSKGRSVGGCDDQDQSTW